MHVTEVALAPDGHFTDYINKILIYYNWVYNEHVRCVMTMRQNCIFSEIMFSKIMSVLYFFFNK